VSRVSSIYVAYASHITLSDHRRNSDLPGDPPCDVLELSGRHPHISDVVSLLRRDPMRHASAESRVCYHLNNQGENLE
jgi:hypothetical protein